MGLSELLMFVTKENDIITWKRMYNDAAIMNIDLSIFTLPIYSLLTLLTKQY